MDSSVLSDDGRFGLLAPLWVWVDDTVFYGQVYTVGGYSSPRRMGVTLSPVSDCCGAPWLSKGNLEHGDQPEYSSCADCGLSVEPVGSWSSDFFENGEPLSEGFLSADGLDAWGSLRDREVVAREMFMAKVFPSLSEYDLLLVGSELNSAVGDFVAEWASAAVSEE